MWIAVRCVIQNAESYEERITLWWASDHDEAIQLAVTEAARYANLFDPPATVLDLAQSFAMSSQPGVGAECFSLIRRSSLTATAYLERFFDSGGEVTQFLE